MSKSRKSRHVELMEKRVLLSAGDPGHVLILSVDGLHQADVADPNLAADLPNTLALQQAGVSYNRASTTSPSDSFPGTLSYLTGAGPGTTGVFYDVSYSRTLFAPGSNLATAQPGTVIPFDESTDKDNTILSGGGNFDASSIDPSKLPIDKHGHVVYPYQFVKVNTIFNVAHQAGLYTAFSDKHPSYDIANGPGGNSINDLYTPEIQANAALLDTTTGHTVNADTLLSSDPFADLTKYRLVDSSTDPEGASDPNLGQITQNVLLTEKYDDLKVQAILNEINGENSRGTIAALVPNLFAMNFQAVSVAQKFINGGIDLGTGGSEIVSLPLQSALKHTDASVGAIVNALKSRNLWDSTLLVLTAKHGQNPRVGVGQLIKDDLLPNVLSAAHVGVAAATQDDVSLLWLTDQSQTQAGVNALQAFKASGTVDVFTKGVKTTLPANQVIDQILSGQSLVDSGLGNPLHNSRTPDIIVTLKPGFILVGNPLHFTFKRAEHGGFSPDDTHVAMILSGGKVPGANFGLQVNDSVKTQQIAVTALKELGLNPNQLKGAKIDGTQALPGLTPSHRPARPSHVVIVIEENHDANQVVGSANAPYINGTLIRQGLSYSNAHGTDHDSQPNYMELFSGANPGVQGINSPLQAAYPSNIDPATDPAAADRENHSDDFNTSQPFSVPNLGAELLAAGLSFTGYSETLPSAGFTGVQFPLAPQKRVYVEKHNPWAQFQGTGTNQLPASTNQPLTAFPSNFSELPTVSFVVPNEINDMHDTVSVNGKYEVGTTGKDSDGNPVNDATTIQHGDNWLRQNLDAYRRWAQKHNSLLITLWDENDFDFTRDNNIPLIVNGDPRLVRTGVNDTYVNHFNVLRTIEDEYGLGHAGLSAVVAPLPADGGGTLAPSNGARS